MIRLFKVRTSPEAAKEAAKVLKSGWVAQGPKVDLFELELDQMVSNRDKSVVTVNSGTSALALAYAVLGLGPKSHVIASPMTCAATILPLYHLGCQITWADVDPVTGLIDPADVAKKVSTIATKAKVAAIVGTSWGGCPIPSTKLWCEVSNATGGEEPPIIEDAAHRLVGYASAPYTAFSFQAIKFLHTGDGGCLVLPTEQLDLARRLRWFGFDRTSKEDFRSAQRLEVAGHKWHMNDLAAAIGLANLEVAKASRAKACANANYYQSRLRTGGRLLHVPRGDSDAWLFTISVEDRDDFVVFMKRRGIECSQVHTRNDTHPVFARRYGSTHRLPGLDRFTKHQVSIPVHWALTDDELATVGNAVEDWAGGATR